MVNCKLTVTVSFLDNKICNLGGKEAVRIAEVCDPELCRLGCRAACSFFQNGARKDLSVVFTPGIKMVDNLPALSNQDGGLINRLNLENSAADTMPFLLSNCRLAWKKVEDKVVYVLLGKDRWVQKLKKKTIFWGSKEIHSTS